MRANISRTRRLSGPGYSFAVIEDSLDHVADNFERNIGRDLHAADCTRQNKVNRPVPDFLVMLQRIENIFAFHTGQGWELSQRADRIFNPRSVVVCELVEQTTNARRSNHS